MRIFFASLVFLVLSLYSIAESFTDFPPDYKENFEGQLNRWEIADKGKSPLVTTEDKFRSGKQSAYSGPPGTMRVSRYDFPVPLVGRLEVWFYDDMAPQKRQIAAAQNLKKQTFGIVCNGGERYKVRVDKEYIEVPVKRSEGWRQFGWDCDGEKIIAFIDGEEVHAVQGFNHIASLSLGSFWDDSAGWWDDMRASIRTPAKARAFAEAESAFRHSAPRSMPLQTIEAPGASGKAIKLWDQSEQEWALHAQNAGKYKILFKYATALPFARRMITIGKNQVNCQFPRSGTWNDWGYIAVPVELEQGIQTLRMNAATNGINLDWIALAPDDFDINAYAGMFNEFLQMRPWVEKAAKYFTESLKASNIDPPQWDTWINGNALPGQKDLERQKEKMSADIQKALDQFVEKNRNLLISSFRIKPFRGLKEETKISKDYYKRLLRYVRYASPKFKDWRYAPGCRYHKRDDHLEHGVRQNAVVAFSYSALLQGFWEQTIAGVPRSQVQEDLIGLLRYITITHKANFLPTGDGEPWGDHWQSAHWAAFAGHAAWLAWDILPDDVKLMSIRMIIYEADRFNARPPDSGVENDTKAEENAWNSQIIALAACMLPSHSNNPLWHESAIVWMLNSLVREKDLEDTRLIDGKPAKDRLRAVTIHPDYTLENHARVHPDYMACGYLKLRNAHLYTAAELPIPESCYYNVPETFDVLYHLTATNGSFFYVNGQDRTPHRHDTCLVMWGSMNTLKKEPKSAFLERSTLTFLQRMHAPFADGSLYDPRTYIYPNPEEEMMARYAEMYLHHRMYGDGPDPVSREEFLKSQSFTRVYDIGGFVTHRTPSKFSSFAWKNGAMGLVFPSDDTWFTACSERSLVGRITCEGVSDSKPKVLKHAVKEGDGFSIGVQIERCEGKIHQWAAMVSLPEDAVFYLERLEAREKVNVREIATATAVIFNEDAPGISPNYKTAYHENGEEKIEGASDKPEKTIVWDSAWVNIAEKMGFVTSNKQFAYLDNNVYKRGRLEEEIIGNYQKEPGEKVAGQELSATALVLLPNQKAEDTKNVRVILERKGAHVMYAHTEKVGVLANLGPEREEVSLLEEKISLDSLEVKIIP
ncbi:hypothetical protein JW926_19010 [Candidatus Sumerlaeota bacterium]|nr:hypothetical protein [Candidatus Sumerlaeota bacterium]